jgi:sensor histidine kinase YesM
MFSFGKLATNSFVLSDKVIIDNTKRRLDLMIGGDLEIESVKGKGTTASILIPKRRE